MSYEKVMRAAKLSVGTKQTIRSIEIGQATEVYVAKDADSKITTKVIHLCKKNQIPYVYVDTMKQLGKACGIEVGAAMAATLKE
jgi:large subunit ribosomal protein L7A